MKYCVIDTETTIFQHGHPYSDRNKLCLVGIRIGDNNHVYDVEYSDSPYGGDLKDIKRILDSVDCVVGFNLKFDLGWLLRYGISLPHNTRIFDCQLAEFILNHQSTPFPSLDSCLAKYGLGSKLHTVDEQYWSHGIDTPQVPLETLTAYLETDLERTDELYVRLVQSKDWSRYEALGRLHMQDLRVLLEMEYNGIRINWDRLEQRAKTTKEELDVINQEILEYVPIGFQGEFNAASNDHVSLLLYGGNLETRRAIPYDHTYKSGPKAGTTEIRNRWETVQVKFPRLVDPIDGTKLAKPGYWSTGADVLKQLTKPKTLLSRLLKQAELSKLLDTYLLGFPTKAQELDWKDGCIHSTLNQCVAITGRLSSSKPNQQNIPEIFNEFITSRYS